MAIGETGLDKAREGSGPRRSVERARQERAFAAQIALAERLDLPLILHVVGRQGACLSQLRAARFPIALGGMVHDFGGPVETIAEWAAAGFCLSISPRSLRPDRAPLLRAVPDALLLAETDDFGPERLIDVLAALAAARGTTIAAIAALTAANARRCLHLG